MLKFELKRLDGRTILRLRSPADVQDLGVQLQFRCVVVWQMVKKLPDAHHSWLELQSARLLQEHVCTISRPLGISCFRRKRTEQFSSRFAKKSDNYKSPLPAL